MDVNGQETVWTEMIRGKDMAGKGLSVKSGAGVTDPELADQAKLGRIKIGMIPADDAASFQLRDPAKTGRR